MNTVVAAALLLSGLAGLAHAAPQITDLSVVSDYCDSTDDGNAWGNHIPRIVRTDDGIFTTFMTLGYYGGPVSKIWHLARKGPNGWSEIAEGPAGREPVSLTAAPDGVLYLVGQPGGRTRLWVGKPGMPQPPFIFNERSEISLKDMPVPNIPRAYWSYQAAGVNPEGDLTILITRGVKPGLLAWATYKQETRDWVVGNIETDYRFAYTYVFQRSGNALALVANRDVMWKVLGHEDVPSSFPQFAFNAWGLWSSPNAEESGAQRVHLREEPLTDFEHTPFSYVDDAYLDAQARMHVLYRRQGTSTGGALQTYHAILGLEGKVLHDVKLPDLGAFARIFETQTQGYFALSTSGSLLPLGRDSLTPGEPTQLDLGKYPNDATFYLSVPRGGTPVSDFIDVVYPSGNKQKWVYFRLQL